MRTLLGAPLLVALACRPQTDPSPPTVPTPAADSTAETAPQPTPETDDGCASLAESDVVEELYARGSASLEESREGDHYRVEPFEAGLEALLLAANNGHLKAQSLYGRTLFGVRFTAQAPTPDEKEDYVGAIAFLRIAARAEDAEAASYMPGLTADASAPLEAPLDSLPDGWVAEAFARADAWIACHGSPEPD